MTSSALLYLLSIRYLYDNDDDMIGGATSQCVKP